jgi:hypothetical protein
VMLLGIIFNTIFFCHMELIFVFNVDLMSSM